MVNQFLFLTFYFKGSRRISSPDVKSQRHGVLRNVSCPGEQRQRSPSTRSTHSEPATPFQPSFSVTSIGSNLSSSPSNHSIDLGSPKGNFSQICTCTCTMFTKYVIVHPMIPTRTGRTGEHFPVGEMAGNFTKTGKVREHYPKYWKIKEKLWKVRGICQPVILKNLQICYNTF